MLRTLFGPAIVAAALLAAAPAMAQEGCSREELQAAVDSYIAAQSAGDPSKMALAEPLAYKQDRQSAELASGTASSGVAWGVAAAWFPFRLQGLYNQPQGTVKR